MLAQMGVNALAEELIKYFTLTIIIYNVVPTILARLCNLGVISRVPTRGRVIITFDDGPDPRYTPRVLEILRAAGVKACFFVIGEKARRHPEIIRKIICEGHEIGSHGFRHRIPWLLGPIGTIREVKESYRIIEEITGTPPAAFRPPWGLFNLFSYLYLCRLTFRKRVVLWSFMSWDWGRRATTENIADKIRKKIFDGSILIFHDSDTAPGASAGSPEKMISALPGIINELKARGYKITLLGELGNSRGSQAREWLLKLWRAWERVFRLALRISDVTDDLGRPTIFRTSARRYFGPRVQLPGGEVLLPGKKVCDLHINNDYLVGCLEGETSPGKIGVRLAGELRRSLPLLAAHVSRDPVLRDTDFLVGITLLHRGSVTAGFTPADIPSPMVRRLVSLYQRVVLNIYHPSAGARLYGKGDLTPKIVVMSKAALLSKYAGEAGCSTK